MLAAMLAAMLSEISGYVIVGVFGMSTINDSLTEALVRARHSAGIEFTILIRRNLCSGDAKGVITLGEKKLFIKITSPIFKKLKVN